MTTTSRIHQPAVAAARLLLGRVRCFVERNRPGQWVRAPSALTNTQIETSPVQSARDDAFRTSHVPDQRGDRGTAERRRRDRRERAGRRQRDQLSHGPVQRRVLVAGSDAGWNLLAGYMFEEAGYTVYSAADQQEALKVSTRLLPDVVVLRAEVPDRLDVPAALAEGNASDIPVVVLTSKLQSIDVHRRGPVIMLPYLTDVPAVIAEADTLFIGAPHTQRVLKRRLTALQELAQYYLPDAEGQDRLRHLIDRLQVAMLAVDETGQCIAASEGATLLTGYSRPELLTTSVLNDGVGRREGANELWRAVLANRPYEGTTTITTHAGDGLAVHAAAVAAVLPGVHVAAFAAA